MLNNEVWLFVSSAFAETTSMATETINVTNNIEDSSMKKKTLIGGALDAAGLLGRGGGRLHLIERHTPTDTLRRNIMKIVFKKMVAMTVVVTMLSTNIAYAATSLAGSAEQSTLMANNDTSLQDFSALQNIPTESLSNEDMAQVEGKGIIRIILNFISKFTPKATPPRG